MSEAIKLVLLILVVAAVAITDIKERRIPNKIILPAFVIGLLLQIIERDWVSILTAAVVFVILLVLYMTPGGKMIGGGDVKLWVLVALMYGPLFRDVIILILISTIPLIIYYQYKKLKTGVSEDIPLAVSTLVGIIIFTGGWLG